jgi:ethanolamine utilization protein EutN
MLTMKPAGTPVVIVDAVGAGVGEIIMVVTGGSARLTEETTGKPVDGTIVGIIDSIEMDGAVLFEKYPYHETADPIIKPVEIPEKSPSFNRVETKNKRRPKTEK